MFARRMLDKTESKDSTRLRGVRKYRKGMDGKSKFASSHPHGKVLNMPRKSMIGCRTPRIFVGFRCGKSKNGEYGMRSVLCSLLYDSSLPAKKKGGFGYVFPFGFE